MESPHIPVLLEEVKGAFDGIQEGIFVDCTLGFGGHSEAILSQNPQLHLIGIDQDPQAIDFARRRLAPFGDRICIKRGRFSDIVPQLKGEQISALLADIGISSLQIDSRERGFSFDSDRLDMRMNPEAELDAYRVVNHYSQQDLERILREYGEVREYRRMADLILSHRPFESAKAFSELIAKHFHAKKIHPATLAFQAIRIEVNDELGELHRLLEAIEFLHPSKALIGIISFHSLEDRIVKKRFQKWSKQCICPPQAPRCECGGDHALGEIVTKKPIIAKGEEIARNPRSRSAKLRFFRFR